jgi:Ran GTPase-activating protein (RanGAP) involved in mRNA processing and transport
MKLTSEFIKKQTKGHWLNLMSFEIEDADVENLLEILHGSSVKELNLRNNKIGTKGVEMLIKWVMFESQVTHLNLSNNKFGDDGVKQLLKCEFHQPDTRSQLTHLYLGNCDITCDGMNIVSEFMCWAKKLIVLDLHGNKIKNDGLCSIISLLQQSQLMDLNLAFNDIGDDAINEFVDSLPYTKIRKLEIMGNTVSPHLIRALSEYFCLVETIHEHNSKRFKITSVFE